MKAAGRRWSAGLGVVAGAAVLAASIFIGLTALALATGLTIAWQPAPRPFIERVSLVGWDIIVDVRNPSNTLLTCDVFAGGVRLSGPQTILPGKVASYTGPAYYGSGVVEARCGQSRDVRPVQPVSALLTATYSTVTSTSSENPTTTATSTSSWISSTSTTQTLTTTTSSTPTVTTSTSSTSSTATTTASTLPTSTTSTTSTPTTITSTSSTSTSSTTPIAAQASCRIERRTPVYTVITFIVEVSGGVPPYTYFFSFGDRSTYTVASSGTVMSARHVYSTLQLPRTATVTITDSLGASTSVIIPTTSCSAPSSEEVFTP